MTYCGPPSASGRQPMPAFCVRPKMLPLGSSRSISALNGRRPSGPWPSTRDESIVAAEPSTCSNGGGVLGGIAQMIARRAARSSAPSGLSPPAVCRRLPASRDVSMKLCRFTAAGSADVRVGLITNGRTVLDLADAGVHRMTALLERDDLVEELTRLGAAGLAAHPLES